MDQPVRPRPGQGSARPLTDESGAFWFFDPVNIEVTIKVLDGRPINGHFWVFIANRNFIDTRAFAQPLP